MGEIRPKRCEGVGITWPAAMGSNWSCFVATVGRPLQLAGSSGRRCAGMGAPRRQSVSSTLPSVVALVAAPSLARVTVVVTVAEPADALTVV